MAGGFIVTGSGEYNGRVTQFVVLSCIVAGMGGILFGYDIGISGGVTSMEPFLKKFFPNVYTKMKEDTHVSNYCKFDDQLLTLFTSSLYLAGLIASFFASHVTRSYGRKPSIIIGGTAFLAGAALNGSAADIYMLIFGRILLGVGVGFANQSVPLYLSEMAPPKHRGAFNNGFQFTTCSGALIANLINYGTHKIEGGYGWRISLGMAAVPASILTLGALFLSETPNSIIQRTNKVEKVKELLIKVRGVEDVEAELDDLIKTQDSCTDNENQFKIIIQRKYRPQFAMSILIPLFQQVTGINVISFYAPILFRTIGYGESASLLSAAVVGGMCVVTAFISMMVVDKAGRRFMMIFGGIFMTISQFCAGILLGAELGDEGALSKVHAGLMLFLVTLFVSTYGVSWGPLGWLIPSEIFPLEIRSAGQSINVAVNFLFTFLVGQTFLSMLCHFKYGIFFFFGSWGIIMTVFVYFLLPETKNVPLEQMERIWRQHWYWKRFLENEENVDVNKV